jgi:hypothetical protein
MTFGYWTILSALAASAPAAFSQEPLEVRTFYATDGQMLHVNARGQLPGFQNSTGCPDPRNPKCFKMGLALSIWGFYVPLEPHEGGFTSVAPPDGTRIAAGKQLHIDLVVKAFDALHIRQRITWQPEKGVVINQYVLAEINKKILREKLKEYIARHGSSTPGSIGETLPLFGKWSHGCDCDPPDPTWSMLRGSASGTGRASQSLVRRHLAPGIVFTALSEMDVPELNVGDRMESKLERLQ